MYRNKAAFIDRDGVINYDYGYVHKWKDFLFCKGVFEGLRIINDLGYKIIIITNQSGIDRGLYSEKDFQKLTSKMKKVLEERNIKITAIYHCPHHPIFSKDEFKNCNCRKPKPGLFLKASKDFNISMNKSFSIGDNERDLIAAKLAGIEKTYLISDKKDKFNSNLAMGSYKSLLEFANAIKIDALNRKQIK